MNKARRKTVEEIQDGIRKAQAELEAIHNAFKSGIAEREGADFMAKARHQADALKARIEGLHSELESPKDEEEEAKDNLPENMQSGDKAQVLEDNVDAMSRALDSLQEAIDALDEIQ